MSDILIKNMEMPKSCGECKLAVNAYGSLKEGKCAVLGYGVTYLRERHDACPLVEVPPHGRLVDGDKLLADHNTNENWDYMVLECIIRNAPTVVEAS